jgi:hypothetical protein
VMKLIGSNRLSADDNELYFSPQGTRGGSAV